MGSDKNEQNGSDLVDEGVSCVDDKWKKINCPSCGDALYYRDLSDGWHCSYCDKFFGYEMIIEGKPCNYGQNS
jgi:ribosomal protein L37AE/L43A